MTDVIAQFAIDIGNAADAITGINTVGIEGDFGDTLRRRQERLVTVLVELKGTLDFLQEQSEGHRRSELDFIAAAPTLDQIEEAQSTLAAAQVVRQSVDAGAVAPVTLGLDIAQMGVAEQAQRDLTRLTEARREAARVFLEEQERLCSQIGGAVMPVVPMPGDQALPGDTDLGGHGGRGGAAPPGVLPGPAVPPPGSGESDRTSPPHTDAPSVPGSGDAGATGTDGGRPAGMPAGVQVGTPMAGATPAILPGTMAPVPLAGRLGPPVMPGYTIPGTTTSAGSPTPMSERDFNSLLDRLKNDRTVPSTSTGMPAGMNSGGATNTASSTPRAVQPQSWTNASTSPTGVADGRTGRGIPVSSSGSSAYPRAGMPMMPMMPGGMNPGAAGRDPKDQPQIKNADPDVYGDDVHTVDPIIDNQGGHFR